MHFIFLQMIKYLLFDFYIHTEFMFENAGPLIAVASIG